MTAYFFVWFIGAVFTTGFLMASAPVRGCGIAALSLASALLWPALLGRAVGEAMK